MSGDAIAFAALCVTLIGILVSFIRKQAVTETEHRLRISALEGTHRDLRAAVDSLTVAVTKLDKHLAVSDARASQGQFSEGDTDPPPRERR